MPTPTIVFAATEAKQNFGKIMDAAQKSPVVIEKSGRPHVVIISVEDFNKLQDYEDQYWLSKAQEGIKSGFLGSEATATYLRERLDGK